MSTNLSGLKGCCGFIGHNSHPSAAGGWLIQKVLNNAEMYPFIQFDQCGNPYPILIGRRCNRASLPLL